MFICNAWNVNRKFLMRKIGNISTRVRLIRTLRTIFERREELQVYVVSPELSSRVLESRQIEKTVYIKAPRSMSYGKSPI